MLKIPLNDEGTREVVSKAAADLGLVFTDKIEATDHNAMEIVWTTPNRANYVHYVEDTIIGRAYMAWQGPDAEVICEQFCQFGWLITKDQLLSRLATHSTDAAKIKCLQMIAILSTQQYDPQLFNVFKDMLADTNPTIRQFAVLACGYPSWPQFRPLLSHIKETDSNDFVKWRAESALQAFDALGVPAVSDSAREGITDP